MTTYAAPGVDQVGSVETHGIDTIPPDEQRSSPRELWWVFIAGQLSFGIIVLGQLPIIFGLSWWGGVISEWVGLLVGSLLYAPFAILGTRTGTNSAVSSGAFFGVVGRLGGSLQNLFIGVGFYALVVWTSGQALVYGLHKVAGLPDGNVSLVIAFLVVSVLSLGVAMLGHANVVIVQKILLPIIALLLVIGYIVLAPKFHAHLPGGHYLLGSYTATWLLSAVTAASLPISYAPFVNDYARYISGRSHNGVKVSIAAGGSMLVGCGFALTFATYTATMMPLNVASWVQGLIQVSPGWYVVLTVLFVGIVGGCGAGAIALYGTGLDTSSIFTRISRFAATATIGTAATALVLVGQFYSSLQSFAGSFLIILEIVTTPWMLIVLVGHAMAGGKYSQEDLQVFNRREKGGRYWYWKGINPVAFGAWIPALVLGLLFADTSIYTGPLANTFGPGTGGYMAFVVAAVVGPVLYLLGAAVQSRKPAPNVVGEVAFSSGAASGSPTAG